VRPFGFITRHMIAKIFLAVALVVGVALLFQAARDAQREADTLKGETRKSAETVAHMIVGAVEHAMLAGEGIQVKALIAELVERVPEARVRVFDQRGVEVFAPPRPAPPPDQIPAPVRATLADRRRKVDGDTIVRPVPSEARCASCHHDGAPLRGVLTLEVDRAACRDRREDALGELVLGGFVHVMTARKSELLDDYFGELGERAPGVRGAAVFDREGALSFGAAIDGLDEQAILAAMAPGSSRQRRPRGQDTLDLLPLVMQERCVACHKDPIGSIRGLLALSLAPRAGGAACDAEELEAVVDTSLRYIMLSQLGRRIADFLDAAAQTGAIRTLELYDREGRRYWTTRPPPPPEPVARVLRDRRGVRRLVGAGAGEQSLVVEPLANRPGCRQCHGGADELRGVVTVSMSTAMAAEAREALLTRRTWFSVMTLAAILVVLVGLLQYLVLRPVRQIGDVADAVSEGNLAVAVPRASEEGDEMARLGNRVNHMVSGLRAKTQLEKFVSRGAARAAEAGGIEGVARAGQRRAATVLFSDIRGFTTFSETVSPEAVVEMLNRVLDAQARVVHNHGGDIDKFVGDALMAVFQGPGAESRAVHAAVAMVAAVHDARVAGESFAVGVGIAAGEVVYGAMGSESRMDFTVIGDVVNTGARLCSAADGDQVLVTEVVAAALGDGGDIELVAHAPLQVKGKREPVPVFAARRRTSPA
jgi:class 3 adenylate cyclase